MGSKVKSGDSTLRPLMNVWAGHIYRVYASNEGKYFILVTNFATGQIYEYPLTFVCLSVRLSVCPFVRLSVLYTFSVVGVYF